MKQVVTIFRAEGEGATRLNDLCNKLTRTQHNLLLDELRECVVSDSWITGFVSFLDAWSMGDDFLACFPEESICRETSHGSVTYCYTSDTWLTQMKKRMRQRHQFPEQSFLTSTILHLLGNPLSPKGQMAIALFRNVF